MSFFPGQPDGTDAVRTACGNVVNASILVQRVLAQDRKGRKGNAKSVFHIIGNGGGIRRFDNNAGLNTGSLKKMIRQVPDTKSPESAEGR